MKIKFEHHLNFIICTVDVYSIKINKKYKLIDLFKNYTFLLFNVFFD
jgi:plasmid maintenance system killer protein